MRIFSFFWAFRVLYVNGLDWPEGRNSVVTKSSLSKNGRFSPGDMQFGTATVLRHLVYLRERTTYSYIRSKLLAMHS
jgi:hypothetical protein